MLARLVSSAIALIPAAGCGTRFHGRAEGTRAARRTTDALLDARRLSASARSAGPSSRSRPGRDFETALAGRCCCVSSTGASRARTRSRGAFAARASRRRGLVPVHDAARPFVIRSRSRPSWTRRRRPGAAIAATRSSRRSSASRAERSRRRSARGDLYGAATPRPSASRSCARRSRRREAGGHRRGRARRKCGRPVAVVLTSRWNIKITYPGGPRPGRGVPRGPEAEHDASETDSTRTRSRLGRQLKLGGIVIPHGVGPRGTLGRRRPRCTPSRTRSSAPRRAGDRGRTSRATAPSGRARQVRPRAPVRALDGASRDRQRRRRRDRARRRRSSPHAREEIRAQDRGELLGTRVDSVQGVVGERARTISAVAGRARRSPARRPAATRRPE